MIYAQFFQKSAIDPSKTIEACGDRSVIIIDGRLSTATIGEIAASECAKRGYIAWQIFKGDAFTRSKPVSQIWYTNSGKTDNSAMSAYFGM